MTSLQLFLLALVVVGAVWQLLLGIAAVAAISRGYRVTKLGLGPLLVATVAFVAYLFTR